MKPTPPFTSEPLLAFGAHPDDIEFGCGGVVAVETRRGRPAHFAVCSRGEAGTRGTPAQRSREAARGARLLGATWEFVELDGDAHLELRLAHALALAAVIRRIRPGVVLAPSTVENQHPDHWRLGRLVQEAARLARYGGVVELRELPPYAIGQLFHYAVTPGAEPRDGTPVVIDVSERAVLRAWTAAMRAHGSQAGVRRYADLQLARARAQGLAAGLGHAQRLWPNDPPVFASLAGLGRGARAF